MARVKRGVIAGRRHKKILAKAKGYYNARRKVFRTAKQAVIKAGQYAYRDRRAKKRDMRALWITRINAAARAPRPLVLGSAARPGRAVPDRQAPRPALAWSASLPNASMSWTAMSASVLRSISRPAFFRPDIRRL